MSKNNYLTRNSKTHKHCYSSTQLLNTSHYWKTSTQRSISSNRSPLASLPNQFFTKTINIFS